MFLQRERCDTYPHLNQAWLHDLSLNPSIHQDAVKAPNLLPNWYLAADVMEYITVKISESQRGVAHDLIWTWI